MMNRLKHFLLIAIVWLSFSTCANPITGPKPLKTLKTDVFAQSKLTDTHSEHVGIRSVRITPEGLWLNEEKTFLRGVNRHQE
jgi:hypothetical protein